LKKEWIKRSTKRQVKYKWKGREQEKTEYYNGRIKALDGRDVLIRDEKNILVYTVQSDEALVMQHATVLANQRLDEKYKDGIDFKQVGFFHDEYTFEVRPQIAEDVKVILEESIAIAGKDFNLNLPQIGEGEIGYNWSEIH
jgi:DNA polymerase I-like protein with 3'-5' exonuclease and polymerase domains